jgi:hypothetical protein
MEENKNSLEAEYAKIREKLAEAAKFVREAGEIAKEHNIVLGANYNDVEYHPFRAGDDGSEHDTDTEMSLGYELEGAMDGAGWRTSSWGC